MDQDVTVVGVPDFNAMRHNRYNASKDAPISSQPRTTRDMKLDGVPGVSGQRHRFGTTVERNNAFKAPELKPTPEVIEEANKEIALKALQKPNVNGEKRAALTQSTLSFNKRVRIEE